MRTKSTYLAGIIAGLIAGAIMSVAMMAYMASVGMSVWTNPNLVAVMWLGAEVAGPGFSGATILGFITHMAMSALMGLIAVPFILALSPWRTVAISIFYATASYPIVFTLVITWANPMMFETSDTVPMTLAHVLFGVVLGSAYLRLSPEITPNRR
ncbi:MAG: hypothetical protein ACNA8W_06845 [Bradymonadaceae bacterium]